MASAPGCPRRGLPLLGGGDGEQSPARPPRLSGGLETADRAQPGSREREGADKRSTVGKGLLEDTRGHRAGGLVGDPQRCPFSTLRNCGRPRGQRRG